MRINFNSFCAKRTKANGHLQTNDPIKKSEKTQLWRDVLAYWILGLGAEFGYVVLICAAHDILQGFDNISNSDNATESHSKADDASSVRQSVCETPSTGVLLIADIVPSMLMNILCPFLPLVKNFRMLLVVALSVSSFLLISSSTVEYLAVVGVMCTSLALGIGEVTLLSYSAQFNKKVITAWSSGTGSAGIIGSISWAGLLALGISPRDTLRIMLIVPAIQAATFWLLLRKPPKQLITSKNVNVATIATIEAKNCDRFPPDDKLSGLKAKLKFIPKLLTFITPMFLVFIFEYICVSGLFEMIYVENTWLDGQSQYRWFMVIYQIGVFSSRTLGAFLKPRRTWWATIAQFINACTLVYMAANSNAPSTWVIFIIVFWTGTVGGICFVHTFQRLLKEIPSNNHKFSLGMVTIAESFGVAIGGAIAIAIKSFLCRQLLIV